MYLQSNITEVHKHVDKNIVVTTFVPILSVEYQELPKKNEHT